MARRLLLSSKARSISLKAVYKMGEQGVYDPFCQLRWPETDGKAVCPRCGCLDSYKIKSRRQVECKGCNRHSSVTAASEKDNRPRDP
ncbi:transposase [Novosphingobium sp. UBA1939]|uniref:transposase n=1 Tax=Novosphingobium sp. UBA1939 TaxID=1946982 RepID=UPI0025DF4D8C|nr:transposase [Novosphingobium sp. UBA1939]